MAERFVHRLRTRICRENEAWRVNLYKFHLHDYDIRRMTLDDWQARCNGPFILVRLHRCQGRNKGSNQRDEQRTTFLSVFDRPIQRPPTSRDSTHARQRLPDFCRCFVRDVDEIVRRQHTGRTL